MRSALMCLLATACLLGSRQSPCAESEVPTGKPLDLAQIFGPSAVPLERRPAIKWLAGGEAYSTLEPSRTIDGGIDVVRYDTASGKRSIAIRAEVLIPAGAAKPLAATDHDWSPNFQVLSLKVAAPGNYWLLDLKTKTLRQLGRNLSPPGPLHPEFSPDSSRVAYVAAGNLHVEAVDGSGALQLTDDGNDLVLNGRGDLAYEEEFSLSKAFKWSPDSRHIAYWQFDTSGVGTFYMIRNTDGQYSKPLPLRYPKPGTTNSAVKVGVVSAAAPGTTWFELSGDPRDNYVPRMDWAGNSTELLIQYENRPQNTNRVLLGDAATGAVRQVMVEHDDSWLIPSDDVRWLAQGRAFTWLSERDGWMHLYVISRDGKRVELRTPGDFDVIAIQAIDEKAGYAYFIAAPDDVTRRYLYRASLQGPAKLERLTPAGDVGAHDYHIAPGAKWGIRTFSTADTPPGIDVVHIPTHERKRTIASNSGMHSLIQGTPRVATEFFKVDIGATMLDAWMMKPPNFDPAKKYPLLMYVYSEPAGQTVIDRWGGDRHLWHMMLAQRGYLIASVDSRGAAAPRGRDWRRSIYGQIGIQASADQAAAIKKMIATRPYIDAKRIGVWGWSGGGAMTLNAMFRYPQLYSTGIAVASPVDQMLYNSIYQERYMGLPAQNPQGYRDGSPLNFAQNLQGNLLIIHGTGDDNVHYQNAEQLVNRLINLNKPFSMMAYPDRTHGIAEGDNTRLHLFDLATRFLETHLPAGAPN
jgi:dipeptidyl-peptidase-4